MLTVKISATIQNEYWTRCVWENEGWEEFPDTTDRQHVSRETAMAMLDDASFQSDAKNGPEDMPPGTRRAYAALAKQLRKVLA